MKKIFISFVVGVFAAVMVANVLAVCSPGMSPGFWKHNIGVHLGLTNGAPSAFEGGPLDGVKCDDSILNAFTTRRLTELYTILSTGGGGAAAQGRIDVANFLNAYFGYGPFED